jgi:hypothetical protein
MTYTNLGLSLFFICHKSLVQVVDVQYVSVVNFEVLRFLLRKKYMA